MHVKFPAVILAAAVVSAASGSLQALDLIDVQPAALSQPQINVTVFVGDNTTPQIGQALSFDPETLELITIDYFTIAAYLDTGASGILISTAQNNTLTLPLSGVTFNDTGVVGTDVFQVSGEVRISLADFYPRTDLDQFVGGVPVLTPYTPITLAPDNKLRVQVGPFEQGVHDPDFDELSQLIASLSAIDIIGMPGMAGKVVVMNPQPVNNFFPVYTALLEAIETGVSDEDLAALLNADIGMHTHLYAPGTPFNPLTTATNPGIPQTSHHVKLTYASFDGFTSVDPAGSPGPTLKHNPFVGKDPVKLLQGDPQNSAPPGVKITRNVTTNTPDGPVITAQTSEGNWLLDTGAAASIISTVQAGNLGVHYLTPPSPDDPLPVLLDENNQPLANQFTLAIGGIGGQITVAGFFLDSLLLRTMEGNAADDNDPNHLRFLGAPVLVLDIAITDPVLGTIILDGILGMNLFVSSANISSNPDDPLGLPTFDQVATSYFDWITFDEPNGILGLSFDPASGIPEPATLALLAPGALLALARRRRRR